MNKAIVFVLLLHVISVFGVMRIVSIQPLNSTLTSAKVLRDGEILWSELINARGGVLINGTYHPVELISIDIGAPTDAQMAQNTINAIRAVANGTYGVVHAMLAPFSSSLTEVHAIEAEKHQILSCAAAGSSPSIFECDDSMLTPCTSVQGRRFEYLVGIQPSAATIFSPAISLSRVQGAKTVGVFRETGANELYFQAVRQSALDGASDNRMDVVIDITVPYAATLTDTAKNNMKQVIAQLQQIQPDVVAGAVFAPGCYAFIEAAKEMNYTAPAFLLSVCTSDATNFRQVLGDSGRYVTGTTLWDRRLAGRVYKEDGLSTLHFFPATMEQSELMNNAAKNACVIPRNMDDYFGYVEQFELDDLTASKINNFPLAITDYLMVIIKNQIDLAPISTAFNQLARKGRMKAIHIRFYTNTERSLPEQQLFAALASCRDLKLVVFDMRGYPEFNNPDLPEIVSKLATLRSLKFKHIKSPQIMQQLSKVAFNTSTIRSLTFYKATITQEFFQQLSTNTSIQNLGLKDCAITENSWKLLCKSISSSKTLKAVEIRPIDNPQKFTEICAALKLNRSIKKITTDSCLFKDTHLFEEFLSAIEQSSCESLTIVKYIPTPTTRSVLSEFLKNNKTLKYIQIGKNSNSIAHGPITTPKRIVSNVDQVDADTLASSLQENRTLKGIALNGCSTEMSFSLNKFAEVMKSNMTLLTLDMSYSYFGSNAVKDIAEIISNNNTLTKLNLRKIMSDHWPNVIEALIKNRTLTSVDLSESVEVRTSTRLYTEAITIKSITKLIENNTTLRELIFQHRNFVESEIAELLQSLKYNTSLTSVDFLAPRRPIMLAQPATVNLTPDVVSDVFSQNYSLLNLRTHFLYKKAYEKYIRRNRLYRLESIVMLNNLYRDEYKLLPYEIWRDIFTLNGYCIGPIVLLKK